MKLLIFTAGMFFCGLISAAENQFVPNELLKCAAVFGWVSRHGNDEEKKSKSKELLNIYFGSASDLSSHEYALSTFKIKLELLKENIYSNPKNAAPYLQSEIERCSTPENLGDRVSVELEALIKRKRNNAASHE